MELPFDPMRPAQKTWTDGKPPGARRKAALNERERMGSPLPSGCVAPIGERTEAAGDTLPGVCRCRDTLNDVLRRLSKLEAEFASASPSRAATNNSPDDILESVAEKLKLNPKTIRSKNRERETADARRMIAAKMESLGFSRSTIGETLGWKSPSTVHFSIAGHFDRMKTDTVYALKFASLK